ncbi:MAG: class I adenylate-forming enzyme family protein [Tenericutes bacterium]|jgi:long-chain acyl-CoA synthetase|nr:class I adenylate-forming enzyme family protein [Mycoplasmatota bacterium]
MKVNLTLYQALVKTALLHNNRNALLFRGKYLTYDQLMTKIDFLSGGLTEFGLSKGDSITFAIPNVFEAVFGFYASSKLGLKCHMVHPITPIKQMNKHMKETNSKTIVVMDTFYEHYKELLEDKNITMFLVNPVDQFGFVLKTLYKFLNRKKIKNIEYNSQLRTFSSMYIKHVNNVTNINPLSTAVYLHSGGTSGEPKTIELSHQAINYLASQTSYIMGVDDFEDKHMLAVLPMFHGFGLCMGIHAMLINGGVNTLMPKFDPQEAIKLIGKNQINYVIGVPSLFESLLKQPGINSEKMKYIDQAFIGGDYVSSDLKKRFDQQMIDNGSSARLLEGYGLTEVVTVCCVNTIKEHNQESVGKALPGIEILIKDLESDKILPANKNGEIIVTGLTVMNGYLNDEKATLDTFFNYQEKTWVKTGDLGFIDEEGYIHFKQRLKRIIKVLGIPVLPAEIENLLMDYEQISEVAAISIPDEEKGNVVKLFVVWKDTRHKLSFEEIKKIIKDNISIYAVPKEIEEIEELPKTPIGKTDILTLEKMQKKDQ